MDDFRVQLVLSSFDKLEGDDDKAIYLDMLEEVIEGMNQQARDGNPQYSDAIYDTCIDYLRELNPSSPLLHTVWSADDDGAVLDEDEDKYLIQHPMLSIQTVKNVYDPAVQVFKEKLPAGDVQVICALKLNGHGLRIKNKAGYFTGGTSRGRSTAGKDLTSQTKLILGEFNEELEGYGLTEFRGEAVLPFDNLDKAREHNPDIKSAFTGVASMIRASAPPEETKLLDFVLFDVLNDEMEFETLSEKYDFMESIGLKVPLYVIRTVNRKTFEQDLEKIVEDMDILSTNYEYYTDGVIVAIDDIALFDEFGSEDKFRLGNLALKIGRWAQDSYSGIISHIEWKEGKSRKTPVAVLQEPVLTATGASVSNIPLYAPLYVLMLSAYEGNVINFRFGGEAGVIPITADGRLVTDKELKE